MSFQPCSLRVAGQDSDIVDIFFPPEVPLYLPVSPVLGKQMYGTRESIHSWIDAIDRSNKSILDQSDSKKVDVFEFPSHPFRTCLPHSPFSDEFESDSQVSFCFAASAWAPDLFTSHYYEDSDETHTGSSLSDDAQFIAIPSDSPWYRRPSPSPGPVSAHEFSSAAFAHSCSSDVRQTIAQQDLLLAIFHEELRRIVPRSGDTSYDSDWLDDMDAELVLAPLETYADLCWESAVCEKPPAYRPMPDVPTGFDDIYGVY